MAKRRNQAADERRKKLKQSQDDQLSTGLFSTDVENTPVNDWDNEEQDYELKPRSATKQKNATLVEALPIKTAEGRVKRVVREEVAKENPEDDAENDSENEEASTESKENDQKKEDDEEEDEMSNLSPREFLIKTKEEISELASGLIENPEEHILNLTRLRKMSTLKNTVTSQLALTALIPIFKSLAPSYKIRPLTDAEQREKVSREVARLRTYEQLLVKNYTAYVDHLAQLAKISYLNSQSNKNITPVQKKLGSLATKAAVELCQSSLRHFNYRKEIFAIVIRRLNRKPSHEDDLDVFTKCVRVLESLLLDDAEHGDITFDIVTIMTKSIRDKKYRVDESVINVFLSLTLLEDYDPNNVKDQASKPKLKKKDKVHLSKKERKARKERKEIEEEMRKAEQAVTAEEREKYQAQVLKMMLSLYLEILKAGTYTMTAAVAHDASQLMAAVLEGLSRFGQMANLDLLGDFLLVLKEIMQDIVESHSLYDGNPLTTRKNTNQKVQADNGDENGGSEADDDDDDDLMGGIYYGTQVRQVLLCIATSFALVLNHSSMGKLPITTDLSAFTNTLYAVLADFMLDVDLEFSHKTLRLADPLGRVDVVDKPAVNVATKAELLLRCLDFIFFKSKNGSSSRAAAFIKRLYMGTLHAPEKTTIATLKFVAKLVSRYGEEVKGLWNTEERISGEGLYVLGIESSNRDVELDRCNSGAATIWENVLLDKHYCTTIKDGSRHLMKLSKSNN